MPDLAPPPFIEADNLAAFKKYGLKHGFFTRKGGCSKGVFASLNAAFNKGDEPQNVMANHQAIAKAFAIKTSDISFVRQTHSNIIHIIDKPADLIAVKGNKSASYKIGDGLVTNKSNVALAILTADCVPLLLYERKNRIIGAVHAGWRGAFSDIIENSVKEMEKLGGQREEIIASAGPSIGRQNYKIGADFYQNFISQDKSFGQFFTPLTEPGKWLFDLWGFVLFKCQKAKIKAEALKICSYENEELFFSYRRSFERGETLLGRQISLIMLSHANN